MQVYTGYHKEQMKKHGGMVVKQYLLEGLKVTAIFIHRAVP